MIPKRILAVHDISGIGKCSLTAALPILSAFGHEVAALPTAVLSTHTGDIDGVVYHDLTRELPRIIRHWSDLELRFDAIYTGFMSSSEQIDTLIESLPLVCGADTLLFVDPVIGDNGAIYKTYTAEMVRSMRRLVERADIITPNRTEAAILTGGEYRRGVLSESEVCDTCRALSRLGPSTVVISDVETTPGKTGAAAYSADTGAFSVRERERVPGIWYGTGDIFASVILGALAHGADIADALRLAVDFVYMAIEDTHRNGTDPRFGVAFEQNLRMLTEFNNGIQ